MKLDPINLFHQQKEKFYPTKFNPMSGEELYLAKLTCFKSPLLIVEKGRYQ